MSGSCPVSAHICRETARERDDLAAEVVNLRNHVRALTEDVARADTLATILDGAREGLARSGSRAKGVRDVQALLTASAVREGVQGARRRVLSTRRREDRGRAASKALGLLRERDEARAEVERLRSAADSLFRKALDRGARGQVPAVDVAEIGEAFGLGREAGESDAER